jgi:hypothetical protein
VTLHGFISAVQAVGLALLLSGAAWAAPVPFKATSAEAGRTKSTATPAMTPVPREAEITGSIEKSSTPEANCTQSRRRLWIKGEGWIVRRVTTCY